MQSRSKKDLFAGLKRDGVNLLYVKLPMLASIDYNYTKREILFKNNEAEVMKVI